jgi:hypothetical protein
LNIIDFLVSIVAMAAAWANGVLAGAWIIFVGTLRWYFLTLSISFALRKLRA